MGNKDFQHQDRKQQQARQPQQDQGGRKNDEEVGEPVQLNDKSMKQGQQKPDMGQREGQKSGQPQHGGQHGGGQHQGSDR